MQQWTWSWLTLVALGGTVVNSALPFLLTRMEKNASMTIVSQNERGRIAASLTLQMLLQIARDRRRWILLGIPVQLCACLMAGLSFRFSIPISIPMLTEAVGIAVVVFVFLKWRSTFRPEGAQNLLATVDHRLSAMIPGGQ
jgi:hypothetical protein